MKIGIPLAAGGGNADPARLLAVSSGRPIASRQSCTGYETQQASSEASELKLTEGWQATKLKAICRKLTAGYCPLPPACFSLFIGF
ncbi:hypothetical protein [Niabella drilacis]|uniref:hypothetical protein n=1 Tax=Niabella drilacis (strain DSM 25811 / CCM 8410 / CCUG 62505 / LMG 26954 / E90) TaxID=1285928 RepID=UPI000B836845|nr:hypothetical protein [Niabella drilacis]